LKRFMNMAAPTQLVQTISFLTGVPLATIVEVDRLLMRGNLRTKSGRGLSVARVTPLDAARLLTAILASPQANESVEAVERYAKTQLDNTQSNDKAFVTAKLNDLADLPARHSFVDALAALITSASTGSLARLIAKSDDNGMPHMEVFAFTRATRGRLRIAGLPHGRTAVLEYVAAHAEMKSVRGKSGGRKRKASIAETDGDLEQSRRLTERTIVPIAKLLAQEN
jgi:hypothetical protein